MEPFRIQVFTWEDREERVLLCRFEKREMCDMQE
uniref:Uncharacterized protein n=1 Tax=Vitis vinifera TaxID=29760 RepID=F6GSL5_VITVI